MSRRDPRYEYMSLADFEEMLPDRPYDEKWELIGGRVIRMMVGARWEHSAICSNLQFAFEGHIRARGLPCRVFRETFWLKKADLELAVFPDILVHCGLLEPGQNSVDDPVVLIEVVSKGGEYRDRIEKKGFYERLPSVAHIVFVTLQEPRVHVLTRKDSTHWETAVFDGLEGSISLAGLGFEMPVSEVYRGVFGGSEAGAD